MKQVRKIIQKRLNDYKNSFIIIKIPVTKEIIYGRKVGYIIRKINLKKNIQLISATKIRKKLGI